MNLALRRLQPDAVEALDEATTTAWKTVVDPVMLELCRLHAAAFLGNSETAASRTPRAGEAGLDEALIEALPQWDRSALFSEEQRAHLDFTERFVTHVAGITDAEVDRLLAHAEPMAVYGFISALYVLEFSHRLDLMTSAVFADKGAEPWP